MGVRIRALVLMGDPASWEPGGLRDAMEGWATRLSEAERLLRSAGLETWTLRISLAGLPGDDPALVERVASAAPDGIMVSIGHTRRTDVLEAAAGRGLYSYFLMESISDAARAAAAISRISSANPEGATRVAVSVGGDVIHGPYFPMSSAIPGREVLAASILYPSDVDPSSPERSIEDLFRRMEPALRAVDAVDYSLSPWMEESVARLIRLISGSRVGEPGSMWAVGALNRAIRRSAARPIGFNEVMLPVEEDSELKEMAREGSIRALDLLRMASVCVAGVDMAVVSAGERDLARFLMDSREVALSARKPLGVRLIPVDGPPGSEVDLGKFGRAFAISLR